MMAGGQVAQKKAEPSRQAENEENLEAALDAPVEEDVVFEAERDNASSRSQTHRHGSASEGSQQDTLADEDIHRGPKLGDAPVSK